MKPATVKQRAGMGNAPGVLGCPPFKDRQKVSLARWDKHSPLWDRMGECIVVGQKQTRGCESGWMVTVMAKDGTYRELDSHWIQQTNDKIRDPAIYDAQRLSDR